MTTTRELQDAHTERMRRRRRWRCGVCASEGVAADVMTAVAELLAHNEIEHPPPPRGFVEAVA